MNAVKHSLLVVVCMRVTFASTLLVSAAACGGSDPQPKSADNAEAKHEAVPQERRNAPQVQQELGSIEPREVDQAVKSVQAELMACQKAGIGRVEYLAGDVKFFVRISHEGRAKWVVVEDGTLGDRETEGCMRSALMKVSWPKPRGGDEAEAHKSFGFDVFEAREPTAWGTDKILSALSKADKELKACTQGVKGNFKVTAYVVPQGKDGKVETAGIAVPSKEGEAKADCVLDVVRSMKLPSPGSYAAKVTFGL